VRCGEVRCGLAVQDRTRPDWCGKVRLGKAVRERRNGRGVEAFGLAGSVQRIGRAINGTERWGLAV
jgi:hypothetical protein